MVTKKNKKGYLTKTISITKLKLLKTQTVTAPKLGISSYCNKS